MRFSSAVTLSCRSVISTRYAGGLQSKLLCPWAQVSEYLGALGFSDVDSPDSSDTVPYWKPLSETLDDYADHMETKSGGDVGLLPRLRMKIDKNQIKYVSKEVANLDASNILGVTSDESCTVYDNLEEKILAIRPRDSHKFGISRSNFMAIQKRIRCKDSQVKLQKSTISRLQKAFSDAVSGNFRNDNRKDRGTMIEREVIMK